MLSAVYLLSSKKCNVPLDFSEWTAVRFGDFSFSPRCHVTPHSSFSVHTKVKEEFQYINCYLHDSEFWYDGSRPPLYSLNSTYKLEYREPVACEQRHCRKMDFS